MAKYHISPSTGRPNQCYATKKACPHGGQDEHYDSKDEARQAYEQKMQESTVAPAARKQSTVEDPQDITTWKPATVDEKLGSLYGNLQQAQMRLEQRREALAVSISRNFYGHGGWQAKVSKDELEQAMATVHATPEDEKTWKEKEFLKLEGTVKDAEAKIADTKAAMKPLEEEYDRRGGWNRAFLVSNGNGHVHSSMRCSTCTYKTQYHWVTDYSDHNEGEIVEAAGERACTVCYPSAPVDTRNRPTKMFTPDEVEAAKRREERAEAKKAKDAEKIAKGMTPDGSEYKVQWQDHGPGHFRNADGSTGWKPDLLQNRRESFKTERAAMSWLVGNLADEQIGWGRKEEMNKILAPEYEKMMQIVADKHGKTLAEVKAEVDKKVAAKVKRDRG